MKSVYGFESQCNFLVMLPRKKNKTVMKVFDASGTDVTPKRLTDENYPPAVTVPADLVPESASREEIEWFKSKISKEKLQESGEGTIEVTPSPETVLSDKKLNIRILTAEDLRIHAKKPDKLFIKLSETDTVWLLSITSGFSQDDSEDIDKVKKENDRYTELTTGKGLTRKRSTAETQTSKYTEKSKGTVTTDIRMTDSFVNASVWDLFDTYRLLESDKRTDTKEFQMLTDSLKTRSIGFDEDSVCTPSPDEQMADLFKLSEFRYALLIAERLLASNNFQKKQSVFKKHVKSKYDDVEPSLFSYDIDELWTFYKELQDPMMVTALAWNPRNSDLLAVGYGHFHFAEGKTGLVCVWSPKNPRHPEREFAFNDPVTSLSYSCTRPNILAVGCRSGDVYVVDVSRESGNSRILGREKIKCRHGPVWKVEWFLHKETIEEKEELLAVGEGGVLIRFTFPDDQETTDLMKLHYIATITKSTFQTLRKGSSKKAAQGIVTTRTTFSKKALSGLWFSLVQDGSCCYVSTKEGVVLKCIIRNPCRTEDTFLAHDGPIYNIEHSPFTDLVYLTCGSDWCLRIWMDGISEPLVTLPRQNPIISAKWSPTIATIIATLSGNELALWDIGRKSNSPSSVYDCENLKASFSTLLFSPKGTNIVGGDQNGCVRVLHLSHLPRQPFLQAEALIDAIERILFTNEKLLRKFRKIVERNREVLRTRVVI